MILILCHGVYEDSRPEAYCAYWEDAVNDNDRVRVAPPQGACPEDVSPLSSEAKPTLGKPLS